MAGEKDFYQVSLKVFLKNDKGEILGLKAARGGSYEGFYDLPGGRIDFDEFTTPFEDIIRRELREEIGDVEFDLVLKPIGLGRNTNPNKESPLGGNVHIFNVFFEAVYKSGEIKISEEHKGLKWINLEKETLNQFFKFAILEGAIMYLDNLYDKKRRQQ
ncbi:MAG: NUDIX hydrolase [Candidatus Pacebacteria bacterium]|nr:NUDIX hydrolase [Candidatus Paceibacterota bacterium]